MVSYHIQNIFYSKYFLIQNLDLHQNFIHEKKLG